MEMKAWNHEDVNLKGNARNGRDGGVVLQSQRVGVRPQDEPLPRGLTFNDYFIVLNTLKELENRFGHANIEGIIKILELMQTHEDLRHVDPTSALTLLSRVNPNECSPQQSNALGGLAGLLTGRNRNDMEKKPMPAVNMGGGAPQWFPGMGDAQMNHGHVDGAAQNPMWSRASLYGVMDGLNSGQKRPQPQFAQQDGMSFNPHSSTGHGMQQQGWGNGNMPGNVIDLVGMHKAAQGTAGRATSMDFHQFPQDQHYGQLSEPIVEPPVSLVRESLVRQYGSPLQKVEKKVTNSSYLVRFNVTVDMSEKLFPKTPKGKLDKSLPEEEREEYRSIFKHEIRLVDVNGRIYSVRYEGIVSSNQRHNRLTTGWCAAARSIGVCVGDTVIFERWTNDRTMIHFYVEKNSEDNSADSATPAAKSNQPSKRRKMPLSIGE
jgi:hypothetical protein